MFNLEQAIAEWRRRISGAGITSTEVLDELENHLRETVQQEVRSGLDEQQGFEAAVRQIGTRERLKAEFGKIITTERAVMKQIMAILIALFGTVFGGALVLPALGRWHRMGILRLWPIIAGSALVIVAGYATLRIVRTHRFARGRRLISIGIIGAAIFYMIPLLQGIILQRLDAMGWAVCVSLALASVLFYGTCFLLNQNSHTSLTRKG